jgi:hypothetical protein
MLIRSAIGTTDPIARPLIGGNYFGNISREAMRGSKLHNDSVAQ